MSFDRRVFLTDVEHQTYLRRTPVRYVKHRKSESCFVCNLPGTKDNPLENAHIVGFRVDIVIFKLTPDFLGRPENIKTAHKRLCNAKVELSTAQAKESLPGYSDTLVY